MLKQKLYSLSMYQLAGTNHLKLYDFLINNKIFIYNAL